MSQTGEECQQCGACCAAYRVDFHPAELEGRNFAWEGGIPLALTVPVTSHLVRMAGNMAETMKSDWYALHIEEIKSSDKTNEQDESQLAESLHLAEDLGAKIISISSRDTVGAIIKFAKENNISQQYILTDVAHLKESWEQSRLFLMPINSNNGRIIGICGFEISSVYFQQRTKQANYKGYPLITAILDKKADNE